MLPVETCSTSAKWLFSLFLCVCRRTVTQTWKRQDEGPQDQQCKQSPGLHRQQGSQAGVYWSRGWAFIHVTAGTSVKLKLSLTADLIGAVRLNVWKRGWKWTSVVILYLVVSFGSLMVLKWEPLIAAVMWVKAIQSRKTLKLIRPFNVDADFPFFLIFYQSCAHCAVVCNSVRELRTNRAQTMRCRYGLLVLALQNFPQSKELSCIYLKTLYFLRRARRAKMN